MGYYLDLPSYGFRMVIDYLYIQYNIWWDVKLRVKIKKAKYILLRLKKMYFYDRGWNFVFTWNKYNLKFL